MAKCPDFYLVPCEAVPVVYPIKCWILKRFEHVGRNECILITLSPQILYYDSQRRILETEHVVISARYEGSTIIKDKELPIYVNIMKTKIDLKPNIDKLVDSELDIIAIGKLYSSKRRAWKETQKAFELSGG